MANPPNVRFSQGDKDIGSARNFSWEYPIPKCPFWDDFTYPTARNFLDLFGADEHVPVDLNSTLDKRSKVALLENLIQERLASRDAAAAPNTLYDVDYEYWRKIWLAKISMQVEVQDPELEQTIRMMIERNKDPSNLSYHHNLTGVLLRKGKFAEAEATEAPVPAFLDGRLGKESPQSLGSRRMIAHAVWKQGRRSEANKLLDEVVGIIDETEEDSQYGVYKESQRELTEDLWKELREGDAEINVSNEQLS